jgi:hypothetical protein
MWSPNPQPWRNTPAPEGFEPLTKGSRSNPPTKCTLWRVERSIELQGRVLMKMIIPNQDKVKRLLLLQLDAQVPEEEQK